MLEVDLALEATAAQGGDGVVLLEVRRCSGDIRQQRSRARAQQRSRGLPEKKTVVAELTQRS